MKRKLIITSDGSHSVMVDELKECYHSQNGSLQESMHTFIKEGFEFLLKTFNSEQIRVFELGFGTGLNAFLLQNLSSKKNISIEYTGIEAFPLEEEIWKKLNYATLIEGGSASIFAAMHSCAWNTKHQFTDNFSFLKIENSMVDFEHSDSYNLVFFDAFAPRIQPELWTEKVFKDLFDSMLNPGVLVTYSSAGAPRRAMTKAGFWLDEIRGAAGKREMTRAIKW